MALVASNAIALPQPQSSPAASINISTTNTSVNNTSNSTTANGTIIISANSSNSDLNILNFALTLENLESNFYTQLLSKFSDQDFTSIQLPGVRATIQEIATSESDHVSFLNTFINSTFGQGQAVPACQYNFPLNNGLQSALQVAGVLEKVGVSAYDGAVSSIQNPNIITAAAAIGKQYNILYSFVFSHLSLSCLQQLLKGAMRLSSTSSIASTLLQMHLMRLLVPDPSFLWPPPSLHPVLFNSLLNRSTAHFPLIPLLLASMTSWHSILMPSSVQPKQAHCFATSRLESLMPDLPSQSIMEVRAVKFHSKFKALERPLSLSLTKTRMWD